MSSDLSTQQSKTGNTSDLTIQPTELKFRFELRKNIPVTLGLHNPGPDRVAFKVKTTSPKKYCVRPSSGLVEPGATKDVQVIMQAQREYPPSLADCKDKFLVQTVKADSKVSDITPELFDATGSTPIKQTKLRVVLVGPPKPPSPVPEGEEEDTSAGEGRNAFKENGEESAAPARASQELAAVTQERNRLRDTLTKVEKDKADIKKRLDLLQLQSEGRPRTTVDKKSLLTTPFTLVHLLIVALLAFMLGHFL